MKSLTCKLIGFQIVGMAAINLWGGGEGTIPMYPTRINSNEPPTLAQIQDAVNDGGFGCESILGAVVRVDALYEHGAKTYGEAQLINNAHAGSWTVRLGEVLSYGHPESDVSVWDLPESELKHLQLL